MEIKVDDCFISRKNRVFRVVEILTDADRSVIVELLNDGETHQKGERLKLAWFRYEYGLFNIYKYLGQYNDTMRAIYGD